LRKKNARRSGSGTYMAFVLPPAALYTVFLVLPILLGIYYSFTDWNGVARTHSFVGPANYIRMFKDARMVNALLFTLRYTALLTVGVVVLALICALCLNAQIKGQALFRAVFFFPAVLSMVVIGLMWNEILYRLGPMAGQALNIEVLKKNILSNPATAQYGILLVNLWQGVATPTVLLLAGLQVIPAELYEAATIDGAGPVHRFRAITLPYLTPVLNVVLVLTVKAGLTLFDLLRGMTDGGPGRATESIGLLIYRNAFAENRFSFGVAQSVVLFVLIAGISVVQFGFLNKRGVR